MTSQEIYDILSNDEKMVRYLNRVKVDDYGQEVSDINYKALYSRARQLFPTITTSQFTEFLGECGIDPSEFGEIQFNMYGGDKFIKGVNFSNKDYTFSDEDTTGWLNNSKVNTIGPLAFSVTGNSDSETGVGIRTADLRNVKEIQTGAFFKCKDLTTVLLAENTKVDEMAFARTGIDEILIPDGVELGSGAFAGCTKLKTVAFDGINISIKTEIWRADESGNPFSRCYNLDEVYVYDNKLDLAMMALFQSKQKNVTVNVMPSGKDSIFDEDSIREHIVKTLSSLFSGLKMPAWLPDGLNIVEYKA